MEIRALGSEKERDGMHPITTTIPATEYHRLLVAAGQLDGLKGEQLPELRLAIMCLIIMAAGLVALALLLRQSERDNKGYRDVIEQMHREEME